MDRERLTRLLEDIHNELANSPKMDRKDREYLQEMEKDIRKRLAEDGKAGKPRSNDQLQETIDRLEVDHPNLTMMLSELMEILSNAGI